jgi:hypothetical protein
MLRLTAPTLGHSYQQLQTKAPAVLTHVIQSATDCVALRYTSRLSQSLCHYSCVTVDCAMPGRSLSIVVHPVRVV